jgi:hypothetical protein
MKISKHVLHERSPCFWRVIPVQTGIQTTFLRGQETIILGIGFTASNAGHALPS